MFLITYATGERYRRAREVAHEIKCYLENDGEKAVIYEEIGHIPATTKIVISVGGDGTIMRALKQFSSLDMPVFGVNAGTIGFLAGAEISYHSWQPALDRVMGGDYISEERLALHALIHRADGSTAKGVQSIANEVALYNPRKQFAVEVSVNGDIVWPAMFGHGVLAATSTGSNAWNLRMGGKSAFPLSQDIALTPMGAANIRYQTFSVPEVSFGGTVTLTMRSHWEPDDCPELILDGERYGQFQYGDSVIVSKSPETLKLATFGLPQYFTALRKLGMLAGVE